MMTVLRCHTCGLPWGRLQDGVLIIESKHHGEKHTNAVVVEKLLEMCQKESTPDEREQSVENICRHSAEGR